MFDPDKFFVLANELARKRNPSESELRTSVNRSYLSSLMNAKIMLEKKLKKEIKITIDIHREIIEQLKEMKSSFADSLITLRDFQLDADYDLELETEPKIATHCVGTAKGLNRKISSF